MLKNFQNNTIWIIISAGLFYLAGPNIFASYGYSFLAWVALVPFFHVLEGKNFSVRLLYGALFSIIAYALILSWVINVNAFLFVFFLLMFAMQPVLFTMFFKVCRDTRPCVSTLFFIPSLWVVTEAVRAFLIGGFAWTFGHTQVFNPSLIQIADITGAYGVSFVVVLINACLYFLIKNPKKWPVFATTAAVVLTLVLLCGRTAIKHNDVEGTFSVCSIQPNISGAEKTNPDLIDEVMDRHLALSRRCFDKRLPDLIVWPETSVTDDVLTDSLINSKIRSFIEHHQVRMLIGTALLIDGKNYNSAVLFDKNGEAEGIYHKNRLLPFNEYFPFADKLLFLKERFSLNNYDFRKGQGPVVLPFYQGEEKSYFGMVICSEEGYPALLRRQIQDGARFIVVTLNNEWFKSEAAMMLHAQTGILQAAAFKVPVIRSSNSGLTCAIDRYGRFQKKGDDLKFDDEAVFHFDIDPVASGTFYGAYGNVFLFVCMLFLIVIIYYR